MATTNDVRKWYGFNTPEKTIFNPSFKVKPGEIEVLYEDWAKPFAGKLMVEPHIKGKFSHENKRWPWQRWQEFVNRCGIECIQCAPEGKAFLEGVERVVTPTFEHAVSVLWHSRGLVTTEGGLHHAAGALNIPAVVIFGAFNSPDLFGYDIHVNISEPDPAGLGQRETHPACRESMRRITVDRVLEAARTLWS